MNRVLFSLLALVALADSSWEFSPSYKIKIQQASSEIEGKEDLMGRYEYELLLTADPNTGNLPEGIRQAELRFTDQIFEQANRLRTHQALEIEQAGPFNVGGRIRAVAFDVRDENTILAGGVSGGIWKSTDGGQTWGRTSDPENRNSITCLVQDTRPGKEDTWYHGTGEIVGNSARGGGGAFYRGDGIYKSVDNGETWNPIISTQDADPQLFNSQFQYIWDIEVNEQNLAEDEILVAAYGGILRSIDGGDSWEVELGQELFGLSDEIDLNGSDASFYTSIEQSSTGVFYATLSTETSASDVISRSAGIYISRDGREWMEISPFITGSRYRRIVMGMSESDPEVSYFLVDSNPILILKHNLLQFDDNDTIQGFDLKETPNFGGSLGSFDTQGSYNMMIRVHPENQNIVFAGGTNLYRSANGFTTATDASWVGGYNPEGGATVYENHHPDQHELLFYPSNPNKILSANDGGLRVSQNGVADSVIWESINNGLITSQFFTIAQSKQAGDPTLIGGMQDNGTDINGNGSQSPWKGIIGGDGAYAATTKDNALWFASFQNGQTLRLTLNDDFEITSFGRVDPGGLVANSGSAYLFVNPFVLDPTNENRMFIAGGNNIYFHPNVSQIPGGSQVPSSFGWVRVTSDNLEGGVYSALDVSLDGTTAYFGASNGEFIRLDNADQQNNFQVNNSVGTDLPDEAYISSISINPENSEHILVVFSNYSIPSIFESMDGGVTFTDISGNLEENPDGSGSGPSVRWGEIIPTTTGLLYVVGTSTGLWSTEVTNGASTSWSKESTDIIGSAIVTMLDYRPSDGRLAIATHGNGVFTTHIPDFQQIEPQRTTGEPFVLNSSFPNPFEEKTTIRYTLPEDGVVRIDVLSSKGELINNLLWAPQFAGVNEITWEGTNASGTPLQNGIYYYKIFYQDQTESGKLILRR